MLVAITVVVISSNVAVIPRHTARRGALNIRAERVLDLADDAAASLATTPAPPTLLRERDDGVVVER